MPYVPGDNWVICDLSGKKVLMSQTRKTWDGLRVWEPLWYPKHPQLTIRAIPERSMPVRDGRSRPADIMYVAPYGLGAFCLLSPNNIVWTFYVDNDGALLAAQEKWGTPQPKLQLVPGYLFTVDDDGALHVGPAPVMPLSDPPWRMSSSDGTLWDLTIDVDYAVHLTEVSGSTYCTVDTESHWWDISDTVCDIGSDPFDATDGVTHTDKKLWKKDP